MHRPGVAHKILPRPRMAREEVEREHIALEPITGTTSRDKVARAIRSAAGQRHHVFGADPLPGGERRGQCGVRTRRSARARDPPSPHTPWAHIVEERNVVSSETESSN